MTKLDYNHKNWKEFSKSVIEIDGYSCTSCGRTSGEVVLQVHHKRYISGLKPWEYGFNDCETLCKGCHASIHGKILPKFGWKYCGDEDLGDQIGICENCGSSIRYQFTIYHINWGTIQVGSLCCDNLTDSILASNLKESYTKYFERKRRFIASRRWKVEDENHRIKLVDFDISIIKKEECYLIKVNEQLGKYLYQTIVDAKSKVFDIVENGTLIEYFMGKWKN